MPRLRERYRGLHRSVCGGYRPAGVTFELENVACLREVFADDEGPAFPISLITRGETEDSGALVLPFLSCLPEKSSKNRRTLRTR